MQPHTSTRFKRLTLNTALTTVMLAGSLQAAVIFTVTDNVPGIASSVSTTSGTLGTEDNTLPKLTYTINNLNLTSVGGGASETIVFDVDFTATGGSPVFNGTGRIAVNGGDVNQIDLGETLTATVSLQSTTFGGNVNLGLIEVLAAGVNIGETWNVIHDGGTIAADSDNLTSSFAPSSFVTIEVTDGPYATDALNLGRYKIEVSASAIPEPSAALLGGLGMLLLLRRRRA